ncbi:hypothetical protein niasHT_034257 [Heterodera trifolii]|uniref:Serpin domain-containing protein n=1 Tax=Heterodera trifolii TaxID=157864 RepID=A0ABD2INF0_9BILA
MAYAGARGQTAAEFVNLLADGDGSSLHQNNAKFIEEIESEKTFNLSIANKIFLDESFTILDDFKATLITYYQGNFAKVGTHLANLSTCTSLISLTANLFHFVTSKMSSHGRPIPSAAMSIPLSEQFVLPHDQY